MNYHKYLDVHGFPARKTQNNNIRLIKQEKIFLFSKFIRRFDICLILPSFDLIKNFYQDKILGEYYLDKLITIKIFFSFKIYFKLLAILNYLIFKKEKIILNSGDIILFGPYSHNYSHVLNEFFTRLIYLKKINKKFSVFIPKSLKEILSSKPYKLVFSKKNFDFKFFNTNSNIEFRNCSYLTHPNTRWIIKDGKKKISVEYKKLMNELRKEVMKTDISNKKKNTPKYIVVSRSNSSRRRLLNENELVNQIKEYGFKKICFEKLSYEKQVELSENCKIMIGYHGAGLTNLIFMKKKTHLIEINNKHYENEIFKLLSMCQNIKYKNFQCKDNRKNLDGVCDIQEIKNYVINIKKIG